MESNIAQHVCISMVRMLESIDLGVAILRIRALV